MEDSFTFTNALYLIEAALFAGMLLYRRRKTSKLKAEVPAHYSFDNAAPFEIEYAVNSPMQVEPYQEIVPNFHLGFDAKHRSKILLSQTAQQKTNAHSSDQRYLLSILLKELGGCEWISIERSTEPLTDHLCCAYSVAIKARSSSPCAITVELHLPKINGRDQKVSICALSLNEEFQEFEFLKNLSAADIANVDSSKTPRMILFLPLMEGVTIDLEKFDIQVDILERPTR